MSELPPIARARSHAGSIALRTATAVRTYRNLLGHSGAAAALLAGEGDLNKAHMALLVSPGLEYPPHNGRYRARAGSWSPCAWRRRCLNGSMP